MTSSAVPICKRSRKPVLILLLSLLLAALLSLVDGQVHLASSVEGTEAATEREDAASAAEGEEMLRRASSQLREETDSEMATRHVNIAVGGTNGTWEGASGRGSSASSVEKFFGVKAGGFWAAFIASLSLIIVSELGDKTFFIAAIMSMKHSHLIVWMGAMTALGGMTVLSAAMGYTLPNLLSRTYTHYASIVLFLFFGVRLLREGLLMEDGGASEEIREVEAELSKKTDDDTNTNSNTSNHGNINGNNGSLNGLGPHHPNPNPTRDQAEVELTRYPAGTQSRSSSIPDVEYTGGQSPLTAPPSTDDMSSPGKKFFHGHHHGRKRRGNVIRMLINHVFWQACSLTFLAEWGDRSQIATIALAAAKDPIGVTVGGCLGHGLCTGVAVVGGKMLASSISEKMVALAGGFLFLVFAGLSLFFDI